MTTGDVPEHVRAANRAAARRDVEKAPPLRDWQVAILAPLLGERPPRRRRTPAA